MQMRNVMCAKKEGAKLLRILSNDQCNNEKEMSGVRKCSVRPSQAGWYIYPLGGGEPSSFIFTTHLTLLYCLVQKFYGSLILWIGDSFCFVGSNFCDLSFIFFLVLIHIRTSYAKLSRGILWNIPLITCIFFVYTLA